MGKSWKVIRKQKKIQPSLMICPLPWDSAGVWMPMLVNPTSQGRKVGGSAATKENSAGQPGFGKSIANGRGCFGCKVIRLPEVCRCLIRFWIFWGDIVASILIKLIDIIGARLYNCMDQSAMQETRAWTLSQRMGSFLALPKQVDFGQIRFQGSGWQR